MECILLPLQVGRGRQSSQWGLWPGGSQERMGGSVVLQGPTSRGKSARLAERHSKLKCVGAVHPDHAAISEASGCLCIHSPPNEMGREGRDKSSPGGVWAVTLTLAVRN